MSEYTPVKATDRTVKESFLYAQVAVSGEKTDQIGTPLTVEITKEFDRWLAQHDAEVAAKAKYDLLMMQLENVRLEVEEERAKEATNG